MLFLLRDHFNPLTSTFEVEPLKGTQYEQETFTQTTQNTPSSQRP
jgi:hypothetical protein